MNFSTLTDHEWKFALKRLRSARLLYGLDVSGSLDCHPLVREHFAAEFGSSNADAFREAHSRLYEHYLNRARELPETLDEMTPLFYAVYHGCRARRHAEVRHDVYLRRILRSDEFFLYRKLGAVGVDLSLLANFFDSPWDKPASELSPTDQTWVVALAGLALRALGRYGEAIKPIRASSAAALPAVALRRLVLLR